MDKFSLEIMDKKKFSEKKYKKLFTPIKIGKVELKNRTIFPPISTNFATLDGHLTQKYIQHYERRAKGGVALIIVENVCIDFPLAKHGKFEARIDSAEFLQEWRELVKRVHKYEAKISVELTHDGYMEKNVNGFSIDKIEEILKKYVTSAEIAYKSGFDMVEIQAAHGLLPNKFLSPLTNQRNDEWGKRTEFAVEIRKRIGNKLGYNFPVTVRLAVDDFKEGGIDLEEGKRIAGVLAQTGYDMIQADIGLGPKEKRLEPMAYPEGWRAYLADKIRPLPVPVVAVGVIRNPETAERILEKQADIVALGRTLIADPDWVNKVKEGKEHLIRRCIGCSECIKARHDEDVAIRCTVNPEIGLNNEETILKKASVPQKVIVIGAGPGGLEATKILAIKGYKVVLYEKENRIGGALNIASVAPGKSKIKWLIDYFKEIIKTFENIELRFRQPVKKEIIDEKPDFIIISTGSILPIPTFAQDKENVFKYTDILLGKNIVRNEYVVIAGAGLVGCETALYLATMGNKVTIVRRRHSIAEEMETLSRNLLLKELSKWKVKILTGRRVKRLEDKYVVLQNFDTGEEEKIRGILVIAFGEKPNDSIAKMVGDLEIPYKIIGNAKSVRKIFDAVKEGYLAAKEI